MLVTSLSLIAELIGHDKVMWQKQFSSLTNKETKKQKTSRISASID